MEKRTLLFVVSLSLTLFLTNIFFQSMDDEANKEKRAKQIAIQEQKIEEMVYEVQTKTAALSSLPIVSIYEDASAASPLESAFVLDNQLLLYTSKTPPKTVYAKLKNKSSLTSFEQIKTGAVGQDQVALFQAKGSSPKLFNSEPLSSYGSYPVQLVFVDSETPTIAFGKLTDGTLSLPISEIAKAKPSEHRAPSGKAIVLKKVSQTYQIIGLYREENQTITPLSALSDLKEHLSQTDAFISAATTQNGETSYYILENAYQQLVFSTKGGSLVEINLPLESETFPKSIVKEIGTDRDLEEQNPRNDRFPSKPAQIVKDGVKKKLSEGTLGGYYPLLRRKIHSPNRSTPNLPPELQSLNIVSKYPEVANLNYKMTHFDGTSITFEANQPHRKILKTFSFPKEEDQAPYCIDLSVSIEGDSRGLWLTSGVPELDRPSASITPALKYRISRGQSSEVESLSLPSETITYSSISPDWVCNSNGFLGIIVDPLTPIDAGFSATLVPGATLPSRLTLIDQEYNRYLAKDLPGYSMQIPLSGKGGEMKFRIYAGPFAESSLNKIDAYYSDPLTGYNPDYISSQSYHGWFAFISRPFAKFLFLLMKLFHGFTGSWAFSIILLTITLRIMLFPLNSWSMRSMMSMQQIAPEVTAIQKRFGKDSKKVQLEIAKLYRERGVNPFSGCLPMLIQMPFLFGMFDLLKSTFELRGASFIPGWIDNLAAPDVLFQWDYPIFFIGNEFHALPIILGAVMYIQTKMSSTAPTDPNAMTDQQRQQKTMAMMMPILFTAMFYNFPSGLNLYWLSSTLLGIAQQWYMKSTFKPKSLK